jgi:hypothetical protein
LLILVFILNASLVFTGAGTGYLLLFIAQVIFYCLALTGYFFEKNNIRVKVLFIPYYFCVMNYAVLAGLMRYLRKSQSAAWEKSRRK